MRRATTESHYELPGTFVIGPKAERRPARIAVAGIVAFVVLVAVAAGGAAFLGSLLNR